MLFPCGDTQPCARGARGVPPPPPPPCSSGLTAFSYVNIPCHLPHPVLCVGARNDSIGLLICEYQGPRMRGEGSGLYLVLCQQSAADCEPTPCLDQGPMCAPSWPPVQVVVVVVVVIMLVTSHVSNRSRHRYSID
jgi:hypothetical protein